MNLKLIWNESEIILHLFSCIYISYKHIHEPIHEHTMVKKWSFMFSKWIVSLSVMNWFICATCRIRAKLLPVLWRHLSASVGRPAGDGSNLSLNRFANIYPLEEKSTFLYQKARRKHCKFNQLAAELISFQLINRLLFVFYRTTWKGESWNNQKTDKGYK